MPLKPPPLDDRDFDQLFEEARLRIPRYLPEWTDFNDSDPGITLLQLFAGMSEALRYKLNQVPDSLYIKLLKLLNLEVQAAIPATALLTFTADPKANVQPVPKRARIAGQPAGGGEPVVFETEEDLDLIPLPLTHVQVFDGVNFTKVTELQNEDGASYFPLGRNPQPNSALYLGFGEDDSPIARPFPSQMRFHVFRSSESTADEPQRCSAIQGRRPAPPASLSWEYTSDPNARYWRPLTVFDDASVGFTREDDISVQGSTDVIQSRQGKVEEKLYWLRCRLLRGSYPAGRAPEIEFIAPNTVRAINLSTVRQEVLGVSNGRSEQSFELRRKPVERNSIEIEVESDVDEPTRESWTQKEDFFSAGPDCKVFTLNAVKGEIRFGDGERGRIPPPNHTIVAKTYRYGGGETGNLAKDLISSPLTSLQGVASVTNRRASTGGREEEKIEDFLKNAPARINSRQRAVTTQDYQALAQMAGQVLRAHALPSRHPDHPDVEVPGAVTVLIVPDTEDVPPRASSDLLRFVCQHLETYRTLTTELFVDRPEFVEVSVEARVEARPYAAFDKVKADVAERINKFLDPKTWPFGRDLSPNALYGEILQVEDVANVHITKLLINNNQPHVPAEPVELPPEGLVFGRQHSITVVPVEDR